MSKAVSLPHIMRRVLLACVIAASLLGSLAHPPPVRAASYILNVNSNDWYEDINQGDGICLTAENNCTLRAAIQEARARGIASGGADTITINLQPGTYPIQGTLYPGNATVIINGNGATLTGDIWGTVATYRLFQNSSFTGEWYLDGLTMTTSMGGGISVLGDGGRLTVANCIFEYLSSPTVGGAISTGSNVALTVMASSLRNNTAAGNGGAISHGHGSLTIMGSTFTGNVSTSGDGGGLFAISATARTASLSNAIFRNNQALRGGGLYVDSFTLDMLGGEVTGNTATEGGGIALKGTTAGTQIVEVRIADNVATEGGGMVVYSDALGPRLHRSTISGNSASRGGGILVHGARMDIDQSAVIANHAAGLADTDGGGGIRVIKSGTTIGPLSVINSTISGNIAQRHGGGLFLGADTEAYLSSATVTANVANESRSSSGAGGGLALAAGARASLGNTILAGNIMRTPVPAPIVVIRTPDVSGNLISRGYNLIGAVGFTLITGDTTGNRVGSIGVPLDAGLGALSAGCSHAHIGSVPTHPLLTTSIAINAANPTSVRHTRPGEDRLLTQDQCGSARIQQGRADMGAAESPHAEYWPHKMHLPFARR